MASTNAGEFKNLDVEMQKTPVNRGVLSLLNSSKQVQNGLPITFSTVTGFISDDLPVIGIREIAEAIQSCMPPRILDRRRVAESSFQRHIGWFWGLTSPNHLSVEPSTFSPLDASSAQTRLPLRPQMSVAAAGGAIRKRQNAENKRQKRVNAPG